MLYIYDVLSTLSSGVASERYSYRDHLIRKQRLGANDDDYFELDQLTADDALPFPSPAPAPSPFPTEPPSPFPTEFPTPFPSLAPGETDPGSVGEEPSTDPPGSQQPTLTPAPTLSPADKCNMSAMAFCEYNNATQTFTTRHDECTCKYFFTMQLILF